MEEERHLWASVLLDWQNIYRCAREAFGLTEQSAVAGTVDPLKLARHLAGQAAGGCRLQEMRIYRGRPDNAKDSRGYSAWRSQTAAWKAAAGDLLVERYRDLRYRGGTVVEKGIDVWLAVDMVRLALSGECDRIVVMSSDTDLVPAIETVIEVRDASFIEVAGWTGHCPSAALLSVPGVHQHALGQRAFDRVADETDYNVPLRRRKKSGWAQQITAEGRRRRRSR